MRDSLAVFEDSAVVGFIRIAEESGEEIAGPLPDEVLRFDPVIPDPVKVVVVDIAALEILHEDADIRGRGDQFNGFQQSRILLEEG